MYVCIYIYIHTYIHIYIYIYIYHTAVQSLTCCREAPGGEEDGGVTWVPYILPPQKTGKLGYIPSYKWDK